MTDDKTVISAFPPPHNSPPLSQLAKQKTLSVTLCTEHGQLVPTQQFSDHFNAGRASDNQIVINSDLVSRHHLEIKRETDGNWWAHDLNSANGVFINGKRIQVTEKLNFPVAVYFGRSAIHLQIQASAPSSADPTQPNFQNSHPTENPPHSVTALQPQAFATPEKTEQFAPTLQNQSLNTAAQLAHAAAVPHGKKVLSEAELKQRLLADQEAEDAGDYTRMVRKMIVEDRVVRGKSYKKVIWILSILFCMVVGLATYQHLALSNTRKLAIDMFYDIKTLEVSLSQADMKLEESAAALDNTLKSLANEKKAQEQIKAEQEKILVEKARMLEQRKKLASMKSKYQQYIDQARSLQLRFPTAAEYEEELIAKVARELGESELELPDGFVKEVRNYIHYWQSSARMQIAMEKIQSNNHLAVTLATLDKFGLPPYFIYLPLQESNYDENAIGPQTRFGIAKGAWQLLASTAQQYGISAGPLADNPEFDSLDERFDYNLATQAAVKYLKRIYSTEAQASGLLVMASYNYGDNRVKTMISNMPDNPRDKNFWKFIQQYDIPKETHDYVFYIFSAAVIGEDPQLFGFKFPPPLFQAAAEGIKAVK